MTKGFTYMAEKNYFQKMYDADLSNKISTKNGLTYIAWAADLAEIKKEYPDFRYEVHEDILEYVVLTNANGQEVVPLKKRFWFDDGKTAWVTVSVWNPNGVEYVESLPIMDFKNKNIPADAVTSMDANKAVKRCLVKAIAIAYGLGLYVYEGEDLPQAVAEANALQEELMDLIKKKSALSVSTANKVAEICKEKLPECNGDPRLETDNEVLKELKKSLLAIRKLPDSKETTTQKEKE